MKGNLVLRNLSRHFFSRHFFRVRLWGAACLCFSLSLIGPSGLSAQQPSAQCFTSQYGAIFTSDTAWGRRAIDALGRVIPRFEQAFGKPAQRPLIPYRTSTAAARAASCIPDSTLAGVREMVLEWRSMPSAFRQDSARRSQWQKGLKELLPTLSDKEIRDSVDLMFAERQQMFDDNVAILMHELGHFWFGRSHIPLVIDHNNGGPGWLWESASSLMEDGNIVRMRRRELIRNRRRDQTNGTPQLVRPLNTFFTMPYSKETAFYAQVRGMIDFLLERTKNPAVFAEIVAVDTARINFAEWLRINGTRYGLPTTIEGLEKEWQDWLARLVATGPGYPE